MQTPECPFQSVPLFKLLIVSLLNNLPHYQWNRHARRCWRDTILCEKVPAGTGPWLKVTCRNYALFCSNFSWNQEKHSSFVSCFTAKRTTPTPCPVPRQMTEAWPCTAIWQKYPNVKVINITRNVKRCQELSEEIRFQCRSPNDVPLVVDVSQALVEVPGQSQTKFRPQWERNWKLCGQSSVNMCMYVSLFYDHMYIQI